MKRALAILRPATGHLLKAGRFGSVAVGLELIRTAEDAQQFFVGASVVILAALWSYAHDRALRWSQPPSVKTFGERTIGKN